MISRPMVTKPGFTVEDAASATVKELEMFEDYELAQLLAEAQFAYDDAVTEANRAGNDSLAARQDGMDGFVIGFFAKREVGYRITARVAERAGAKLFQAYGRKLGLI